MEEAIKTMLIFVNQMYVNGLIDKYHWSRLSEMLARIEKESRG